MNSGWIKLHRKFLSWEWAQAPETSHLFIHLLFKAEYKDKKWKGIDIKRGQCIVGRKTLAQQTGLSEMQIRTSLKRLEISQNITSRSTNRFTLLTIVNYEFYQGGTDEGNQQNDNKQPTDNQQTTTSKEVNNKTNKDPSVGGAVKDALQYTKVAEIYNQTFSELKQVKLNLINDKRKRAIKKLFKFADMDLEKWQNYLNAIAKKESCAWMLESRPNLQTGQTWKAKDFDYFITEGCYIKVKESE